jgi:hypothetical protein
MAGPVPAGGQTKVQVPVVVDDTELLTWVDAKVKARMPAPGERAFDDVGWAKDIRTGLKLAKQHQRPVFLFTHDGRMNFGRC